MRARHGRMGVAVLKDLGNFEKVLRESGNQITLRVIPSLGYQTFGVEVNNGHMLVHTPDKSQINPPKNITSFRIPTPRCQGTAKSASFTETPPSNSRISPVATRP